MYKLKVLVIGGGSTIGSKIVKYFIEKNIDVEFTHLKNNVPFGKGSSLDITKKDNTIELISKIRPNIVIHTSALTNVDLCETNRTLADSINVEGTANVIEGCKRTKSKLVYISTSFVFSGKKDQCSEEEKTSPSTYYGLTKLKGEELVRQSDLKYLILRTDQPYGWAEKWQHTNSVLRILQTLQGGNVFTEVADWYNTPTYIPDFVSATVKLLELEEVGIFHLVGSDFISRYEWALVVCEIFGLDKKLIASINSTSLNLAAKRGNVHLNNEKLFQKTGIRMMGVRDGLMRMIFDHSHLH